ncbi:MAG: hypothetical protein ACR2HW_08365, partial [Gemmatimonadales bacterium]
MKIILLSFPVLPVLPVHPYLPVLPSFPAFPVLAALLPVTLQGQVDDLLDQSRVIQPSRRG